MKPKHIKKLIYHVLVGGFAILLLYPVLWLVMSSFKLSERIFVTADQLIPDPFVLSNYAQGWEGFGDYGFGTFIMNTAIFVVIVLIGHLISCSLIAFGFARLNFAGRKFWFAIMIMTLMLPYEVVMIPQYIIFAQLDWLNSLKPLVIPAYFGHPFFIFLLVQFIRTIPRDLDEAAIIDGSSIFGIYYRIILPLIVPALATTAFLLSTGHGITCLDLYYI
ncbi:rhamnose oligosaccharide ABC transport system [Gracilibacillus boraciitolerans JCM 21714]|uniref:Rhamnose oligosaccharide ABC transport system n=1 Tax=Gracilibacillus boraciitolerans JCM 21714 TaxID=1298598 RepID=W4VI20_9BACI|nr:rhamnose oligosaccharide ABC transport system [Gracilibacillus boraciitolerans JCM 21714]